MLDDVRGTIQIVHFMSRKKKSKILAHLTYYMGDIVILFVKEVPFVLGILVQ